MLLVHLVILMSIVIVIEVQGGTTVRTLLHTADSVVVDDATSTLLLQTDSARGAHIVAQCQARCYQHIENCIKNTTVDDNDPEVWKCNKTSALDDSDASVLPCEECLVFYNATQDDCTTICNLQPHNCSENCQHWHHIKVDNTITQSTTSTSLELVCKDVHDDGASLILQLIPPPISNEPMSFVVEVKHSESEWNQILISNSSILELRKLDCGKDYHVRATISGSNGLFLPPIEAGVFHTLEKNYTPTAVQQINVPKVRVLPGSNELALNVSWNPTGDRVCCHRIRRFGGRGRNAMVESMFAQTWNSDLKTYIGEQMTLVVVSCTSYGEESDAVKKKYQVPQCAGISDDTSLTTSEKLKHCLPPTIQKMCSQEVQSPTDIGIGGKLVDLQLTWQISPIAKSEVAPRIVNIRIVIDKRSRETENITVNIPVKDDSILHYNTTISDMDVTRNGYNVLICVENEYGVLGPLKKLERRVETIPNVPNPRGSVPGFRTSVQNENDDCPPIIFSTTTEFSQHMSDKTLIEKTAVTAATMATIAATLVLVIAGATALIARRYSKWRRIKRHELKRMYLQEEENKRHIDNQSLTVSKTFEEYEPLQQNKILDQLDVTDAVSNTEHHLKFESLRLGSILGEGAFGVVRCAQMRRSQSSTWQTVAVKMLKDGASGDERRQLQREVALMKSVGRHPHIVCMLACSDPNEPAPAPYLVVEHCALGDLQNYLRHQWKRLTELPCHEIIKSSDLDSHCSSESESQESIIQNTRQIFVNRAYGFNQEKVPQSTKETGPLLTPAGLLSISRQVAMGMEYLSMNHVVHRDLAARNVLVTADRSVKIADFGLSRDVYEQNVYHKTSDGRLPIKWMALESLLHQLYTSASDVWSFGILLWEIVTLGGNPYPGIATSRVFNLLRSGYRMERPENCNEELYDIMLSCWMPKASDRPNFSQLRKKIENMLETCSTAGPYLPLHDYSQSSSYASDAEISEADTEKEVNSSYLQPVESTTPEEISIQID